METVACNLCGSAEASELFSSTLPASDESRSEGAFRCTASGYGSHFRIVQCRQCGLAYASPRYDRAKLLERYRSVKDPLYLEESEGRRLTFRNHLAALERWTGSGAGRPLLDVGAYTGVFVDVARQAGWQAEGLEPSSWAVDHARACGLPMIEGTLESAHLPNAAYAVLTMWDVIEHLGDPLHELREAWQVLRPGGYLAVHTMDRGSLFARVMGRRWPWLMEMHLYYFSTHTLRAILKEAGFEVLAVQPQGRYLRLGYLATRVKPYSRLAAAALDRVAKVLRLRELAVPVNFGDLITAYARKPS